MNIFLTSEIENKLLSVQWKDRATGPFLEELSRLMVGALESGSYFVHFTQVDEAILDKYGEQVSTRLRSCLDYLKDIEIPMNEAGHVICSDPLCIEMLGFILSKAIDSLKNQDIINNYKLLDKRFQSGPIKPTVYRSVTEILYSDKDTSYFTQEAAELGTKVHEEIEVMLSECDGDVRSRYHSERVNKKNPIKDTEIPRRLYNTSKSDNEFHKCCNSFIKWTRLAKPYPLLTEKIFVMEESGKNITGQVDFVGMMEGQKGLGILDWKTSNSFNDIWRDQICLYAYLLDKNGIRVRWGAVIMIDKTGKTARFVPIFISRKVYERMIKSATVQFWEKYHKMRHA